MDTRGRPRVKNKGAAPVQISAEQLLREAVDRQEVAVKAPTQRIEDLEELHEYQGRKRREYEDYIRRNRINLNNWLRYAQWELEQKEFARARSIFERALDNHPTNVVLWLRYVDAELKNSNINHARNLLNRAVTQLPRVDKLWYKYVYLEEMLNNIPGTRQIFERWMSWRPDEKAWNSYIKLEKRYGEYQRARQIFQKFTFVHPDADNWIKWAKFEEEYGTSDLVRDVFGLAVQALSEKGADLVDEKLFVAYARFEAKLKEYERARAIYKYALDRLPRSKSATLYKAYTAFEKQFGDTDGVEDVVLSKRRLLYEQQVKESPKNYDTWIDFARLEESAGDADRVRDVYERAVAQVPPTQEKRHWRRYIYLWIFYALWEELEAKDIERARQVYKLCLDLIPHRKFTFAKIWLLRAQFEIRHGQLQTARKLLGMALGICPKSKLYRGYIDLEMRLYEFTRCRILYEKYIQWNEANCQAWISFAELERSLDELDRVRAIYELGIDRPVLDMPELLWKSYIDFEESEGQYDRTRRLYERLLEKTDHVKVWISYARFEATVDDGDKDGDKHGDKDGDKDGDKHGSKDGTEQDTTSPITPAACKRVRDVFKRGYKLLREKDLGPDCLALLQSWLDFERRYGSVEESEAIRKMMPRIVRKTRKVADEMESGDKYEEYEEYVFPEMEQQSRNVMDMLAMAQKWKQQGR